MEAPFAGYYKTPFENMMIKYKEFYNINEYYIKLGLMKNNEITFTLYNMKILDSIKYHINLNIKEIYNLSKLFKIYDRAEEIYENIINIIEGNNYKIIKQKNNIILFLYLFDIFQKKNEVQIILNKEDDKNEYLKILSKEIIKLKQENFDIKNELKEIRNIIYQKNDKININEKINKNKGNSIFHNEKTHYNKERANSCVNTRDENKVKNVVEGEKSSNKKKER